MTKKIEIVQVLDPPSNRPFILLETYQTSDGLRTRIVGNRWKSLAEAMSEQKERMDNAPATNQLAIGAAATKLFEEWRAGYLAEERSREEEEREVPGVMRGS